MDDVVWPITNVLVHTRGAKAEVTIHRLGTRSAALILRFGGASDVTLHCATREEIIDIHRQLGFALDQPERGEK